MQRTQHPSNNQVLGAPAGWDQSALPCDALPITRTTVDGVDVMCSFWRPDPAELAALQAGGLVVLQVLGKGHPPVAVGVVAE